MRSRPAERGSAKRPAEIPLEADLAAVLAGDRAVYLRLGPEGAVMTVKAPETFAFGETVDQRWHRMTPQERTEILLGWIRRAAKYSRRPRVRWRPTRPLPA